MFEETGRPVSKFKEKKRTQPKVQGGKKNFLQKIKIKPTILAGPYPSWPNPLLTSYDDMRDELESSGVALPRLRQSCPVITDFTIQLYRHPTAFSSHTTDDNLSAPLTVQNYIKLEQMVSWSLYILILLPLHACKCHQTRNIKLLTMKIGIAVQTGMKKMVRLVWVTLSKCRFDFTIT